MSDNSNLKMQDNIPALSAAWPECLKLLKAAQKVMITTHVNADGDAIGSQLGLYHLLRQMGKFVTMVNPSPVPPNLLFLNGSEKIESVHEKYSFDDLGLVDTIVVLDVNTPKRLPGLEQFILKSAATKIVIDHHLHPQAFADLYVMNSEACAVGFMLHELVVRAGSSYWNADLAMALYVAIMTDTGNFRFPRTNADVHRAVATLLEAGADPVVAYEQVYNQGSIARLRLLGQALAGIELFHNGQLAVMQITQAMLGHKAPEPGSTEGFVEQLLAIEGVRMGALLIETGQEVKISLRSKGKVPVNMIADQLGGGGHGNAAGARVQDTNSSAVARLIVDKAATCL